MKNTGFTLIETIIAIVVLALALSGAVFLTTQLINTNQENKDRVQATYLAQECHELLRNHRDTAWKQHNDWLCAFDPADLSKKYSIESEDAVGDWNGSGSCSGKFASTIQSNPTDTKLYRGAHIFSHNNTGSPTKFSREISIDETKFYDENNNDSKDPGEPYSEVLFSCQVSWGQQSVKISSWLTNWLKL